MYDVDSWKWSTVHCMSCKDRHILGKWEAENAAHLIENWYSLMGFFTLQDSFLHLFPQIEIGIESQVLDYFQAFMNFVNRHLACDDFNVIGHEDTDIMKVIVKGAN